MNKETKTFGFNLLDMVKMKTQKKEDEPFVIYARAVLEDTKGVTFNYFLKNSKANHTLVSEELLVGGTNG